MNGNVPYRFALKLNSDEQHDRREQEDVDEHRPAAEQRRARAGRGGETTSNSRTVRRPRTSSERRKMMSSTTISAAISSAAAAPRVYCAPEKKLTIRFPIITPLRAADELRREVLAEDRDEDEDHGRRDPRLDLRQQDPRIAVARRRAEVHRRLELIPVEALERRVQRQRREREVEVDEHEDHRRPVVEEERDRVVRDARPLEEAVDRALRRRGC